MVTVVKPGEPEGSSVRVRVVPAARQRIPLFLRVQAECLTCGKEIRDALTLEEWGRHCSARCYFGRGLPPLLRQGA